MPPIPILWAHPGFSITFKNHFMYVCMYVCMYVFACSCVRGHTHTHTPYICPYTHRHTQVYIHIPTPHMCTCTHRHTQGHIHTPTSYIYVYTYNTYVWCAHIYTCACVCVHACTHIHIHTHSVMHTCGNQRTTCRSYFLPFTMWLLKPKLRLSVSSASVFNTLDLLVGPLITLSVILL